MIPQLAALLAAMVAALSLGLDTLAAQMAPEGYLMLVNPDYRLAADYVPPDLVYPDVKHSSSAYQMRREAAGALEELFAAAKEEAGLTLYAHSGYRSYGTQQAIYQSKVINGKNKAQMRKLVAEAGASEHQLGLAMDIKGTPNGALNAAFGKSKAGVWLAENADRFGYIIRYKAEWTEVTSYAYEPWHIRYVGKEHAALLRELDIPLEEYVEALRSAAFDEVTKGD